MCGYCVSVIGRYLLIKSSGRFIDRALISTYFCPCAAKFPLLGINKASSSLWTLIPEQLNQQFSRLEAFIIPSEVNRVILFVTSWSYWSDWMFWSQLFPFCSSQREGTNNFCFRFRHSLVDCVDKTPDYVEKYNKKYNSLRTVYLNSGKVLTLKMNFFQPLHEPCHTRRSKILIPVFT